MFKRAPYLWALALGAAMLSPGAALQAQNNTVGPAELRDFRLPGITTTPPPREVVPSLEPVRRPPAQQPPPRAATPTPTPTPARQTPRPDPASTAARPAPAPAREAPRDAAPAAAESQEIAPVQPEPLDVAPIPAPVQSDPVQSAPAAVEQAPVWPYVIGGLLALLGLGSLLWRRRSVAVQTPEEAAPEAPVQPIVAPEPPAFTPISVPAPRPRLELEFLPLRAAATAQTVDVQYELRVRNVGNIDAHNVRIEAQIFCAGAGQDQEIGAFFADQRTSAPAEQSLTIPPGREATASSAVAMPMEAIRPVNVQGRSLFIPMVAFNVLYQWADGRTGQTSQSYLVGREVDPPAEKMGAFRLDLGPRIYRSVGQRRTEHALVV